MLPLVSSTMPRLTGTRSLLKCVIGCSLVVLEDAEVFLAQARTRIGRVPSVTVAVTLISSTRVRKRKDWLSSCWLLLLLLLT